LKREIKQQLIRDLKYSLLQLNVEFTFQPNEETVGSILLNKWLYFDGLYKNIFFDAVFLLIRASALILLTYQELLTIGSNSKNIVD
jgi:hypothetical protein